ncbi:hypothetical protein B296_00043170, partial [Ensete ventricosum]
LNSRVLPSSSLVSKQWPGKYVGAADVLTQISDRRASFNGVDFVYSQRGIHYIEIYLNGEGPQLGDPGKSSCQSSRAKKKTGKCRQKQKILGTRELTNLKPFLSSGTPLADHKTTTG